MFCLRGYLFSHSMDKYYSADEAHRLSTEYNEEVDRDRIWKAIDLSRKKGFFYTAALVSVLPSTLDLLREKGYKYDEVLQDGLAKTVVTWVSLIVVS